MTIKALLFSASLTLVASSAGCSRSPPSPVAAVTTAQQPHDATHDSHDEHARSAATPKLPPGQVWSTDEPLRTAMVRIRTAVQKAAADPLGLAIVVEQNVAYMIANCKLEPQPDAALHMLIGRMMSAAAALKNDPASEAGTPELLAVLRDYQSSFDHPGWVPLPTQ